MAALIGATMSALMLAGPAQADEYYWPGAPDYAKANYPTICDTVAQEPSADAMDSLVTGIASETSLTPDDAQAALGYAIGSHCPQYGPAYTRYRTVYP